MDLTARLSQIETNVDLEKAAFTVDVPRGALPITLEELRDAGPLRDSSSSRSREDTEAPGILGGGFSASPSLRVP